VRLAVTALHGGVKLDAVAWEKLVPTTRRDEDTSFHPEVDQRDNARAWFGVSELKAGQSCISAAIPVPADVGPVIVKIAGDLPAGAPGARLRLAIDPEKCHLFDSRGAAHRETAATEATAKLPVSA